MRSETFHRYFLLGLCFALLALSLYLIRPYVSALLAAGVLAYMFYPIYSWLERRSGQRLLSSLLVCILVTVLVILPFVFLTYLLVKESVALYSSGAIQGISDSIAGFVGEWQLGSFVERAVARLVSGVGTAASEFFVSIPGMILQFLITLYTLFFLLIQGKSIFTRLERDLPLDDKRVLFSHVTESVYGVVYGFFVVAILETVVAALLFWALGVRAPLLWALAIGFLALLPLLGPSLVWIPLTFIYLYQGALWQAIGILLTGIFISALIDTVLRQKIIGDRTKIHPVIALLGILGGLQILGFIGVVIGPIILSLTAILAQMYYRRYVQK